MVKHYQPRKYDYPEFEDSFRALLRDAEAAADVSKHAPAQRKQAVGNGTAVCWPAAASQAAHNWRRVTLSCMCSEDGARQLLFACSPVLP